MKAVLFDMYGVIIREPKGNLQPYAERHIPGITEEQVYANWIEASKGLITSEEFLYSVGLRGDLAAMQKEYLDTLHLNDGIFKAVEFLRTKQVSTALLSNDTREWNEYLRGKSDLDKLFDVKIVSGEVGLRKPMPEIYLLAVEKLGVKPEDCVFVDDQDRNLIAAQALGIKTVSFRPDGQVRDFDELVEVLEKM